MPYGDHGRRMLYPYSVLSKLSRFPFAYYYNSSSTVKIFSYGILTAIIAVGILENSKYSDYASYTPYTAIHHKLTETMIHQRTLDRYPPQLDTKTPSSTS
ncbi:hypothetical protein ACOME3_004893 [Neoechinorhynchus agilis]